MTAAQNFALPILEELEPPPLLKLSFTCYCIFLIAITSRFFDWKLSFTHVPMITSSLALMGAALEGRLVTVFRNKIGACVAVLTALYAMSIPFSIWKGGSFAMFSSEWLKTVMIFAISGALIFNVRQCRTALHSIGWGTGLGGLLVNWKGEAGTDGRLTFGTGSFKNANEIAFAMVISLPFLWLIVKDPQISTFKKVVAVGLMASNCVAMLRSGSRGGLIGFAVLCLIFFLRSSMVAKLAMTMAGVVALAGVVTVMPSSLKSRYATLVSSANAAQEAKSTNELRDVGSAESSSAERRRLLMASIDATLSHPIFGVGLGEFNVYEFRIDTEEGRHSGWQGTHNTYTQISSEAGIPALVVFVCMILFSVQVARALSKRAKSLLASQERVNELIDVTFALTTTLIVYAVCICFDYIAYSATMPILAGLVISLERCGNQEMDRLEGAQSVEQRDTVVNLYPVRRPGAMQPAVFRP